MNNQAFKPTDLIPNGVKVSPLAPLARTSGSRVEAFPENHALQFDGYPRLIPIVSNQRINRALSRYPVNIPTHFAPSLPKGEKTFEPSIKMRTRLKRLGQTLDKIYFPKEEISGEIRIKEEKTPPPSPPLPIQREFKYSPELEEIKKLREKLAQKEAELTEEKSRKKVLDEKIKTYQKEIASLTEKTRGLTSEIEKSENELAELRSETLLLRQRTTQKQPDYQQAQSRVDALKNSLDQSRQLIENLQQKAAGKEKLLQKFLAESQQERLKAQGAISDRKSVEALVKNLRVALQNAREELKRAQAQKIEPTALQIKEEQIQKLSERLQQKEQEAEHAETAAEKATVQLAEEEKLKNEIGQLRNQIANLQKQNQAQAQRLQNEEEELGGLRASVQTLTSENQKKQKLLQEQEKRLEALRLQKEKLASFADELSQKLSKIQSEKHLETIVEAELGKKKPKKPVVKVAPPKGDEVSIKPLTTLPNSINGVVLTANGNLIENAVVIIKDKFDNSLRALRTNELGQFLVATPLPNGTYHLEVESKGEKFDILEIELTGDVLAPIEIKAK